MDKSKPFTDNPHQCQCLQARIAQKTLRTFSACEVAPQLHNFVLPQYFKQSGTHAHYAIQRSCVTRAFNFKKVHLPISPSSICVKISLRIIWYLILRHSMRSLARTFFRAICGPSVSNASEPSSYNRASIPSFSHLNQIGERN